MTITLELTPEQEGRLTLKARQQGKPLDVYVREAVDALTIQEAGAEEQAAVDEGDTLGKLIDACRIDTGIVNFAQQHDHYLHGSPRKEQALYT